MIKNHMNKGVRIMFNYQHYVPVLKGKLGEYSALKEISNDLKDKFTPLIEIPPIQFGKKITVDKHIEKVGEKIKDSWGSNNIFFLDLPYIDLGARLEKNIHPLEFLANDIRKRNLKMVPVTGFDRDEEYQKQIRKINSLDNMGFCLRIYLKDIKEMKLHLKNIKEITGINTTDIDLIFDLKYITDEFVNLAQDFLPDRINSIPELKDFRNFVFLATHFPRNLSQVKPNTIYPFTRYEWKIWRYLIKSKVVRKPTFGDYAIANPEIVQVDPRYMRMSVNIRYTAENEWFIFKGGQLKRVGSGQFHKLSKKLFDHKNYCGEDFSSGDLYIKECAEYKVGPGNATTWRKVGTNHHITFVVNQIKELSNFSGIEA